MYIFPRYLYLVCELHLLKLHCFFLSRIFGFAGMILVLWSPVAIPLLPTIVQGWTTNTPSKIAEAACIIGLYIAIMILVMIWGKRIRGYENAFEQYGLDLTSKRVKKLYTLYIMYLTE
jgi:hypothetical protein